jgi:hypothetical protein
MGAHIIAGPSNTVVLDKQQLYWMAGKVRQRQTVVCYF